MLVACFSIALTGAVSILLSIRQQKQHEYSDARFLNRQLLFVVKRLCNGHAGFLESGRPSRSMHCLACQNNRSIYAAHGGDNGRATPPFSMSMAQTGRTLPCVACICVLYTLVGSLGYALQQPSAADSGLTVSKLGRQALCTKYFATSGPRHSN